MTLRERIVAGAIAAVGLGAHDPEPFEELIGAGELEPTQNALTTASTCGLVVAGLWQRAGIRHPRLAPPYRIGSAISRLLEIAHEHGAWVAAKPGLLPRPGDMVGLALFGPNAGHMGHVYTVVSGPTQREAVTAIDLASVDGGQVDERGRQVVRRKGRIWTTAGGTILDGAPGSITRSVDGWIDVDRLERLVTADALLERATEKLSSGIVAAFSPVPQAASNGGKAIVDLEATPVEGIDVSQYNGAIQWVGVPAEIRFGVVRATVGVDQRDLLLVPNANGVRSTGRELAVYGVCLPGRWDGVRRDYEAATDAERAARQLAACHREMGATLRPWVDVEPTKETLTARVSGRAWKACALTYLETMEHEGIPPAVYTNGTWWDSVPELRDEVFARWPLVASDYRGLAVPFVPRPWERADIYQYAGGDPAGVVGHVAGVPTVVDRDRALRGLGPLRL